MGACGSCANTSCSPGEPPGLPVPAPAAMMRAHHAARSEHRVAGRRRDRARQALRRGAGQGADQSARVVTSGRADGEPGSGDRRFRSWIPGRLPDAAERDHPARVAQHGRGRAPLRRGADDESRPHRRSRRPEGTASALRSGYPRGSIPRHRPRLRRGGIGSARMIAVLVSCGRIWTLALRHIYLLRGSWPRVLELVYWPAVQIVLWGFISVFLRGQSSFVAHAFGVLLAGVMLWDLMFRGQLGVSISFFEEMWSRNLGNLFVSPLRPWEMIAALLTMSVVRTLIAMVPASILAILFFHFSIYSLGWPLLA